MKNYVDLVAPETYQAGYEPLVWAKKYCTSYITNQAIQHSGAYYYRFYFSDLEDAMMFKLKWL